MATDREVYFESDEVFLVFSSLDGGWEARFYNPYGDSVTVAQCETQEEATEYCEAMQYIFNDWTDHEQEKVKSTS